MKYLNIDKIKLQSSGITLIEASAGTGKTLKIIKFYLQLLLERKIKKKNNTLSIHNIAILTFTNSSKNDLKKRFQKILMQLYYACEKKKTNIIYLKDIILKIKDFKMALETIKYIKKKINEIKIYTLYSYFWTIIQKYQFFFKKEIPIEIYKNSKTILFQSIIEFWRVYIYKINKNILKIILKKWNTPQKFYREIHEFIDIPFLKIKKKKINLLEQYSKSKKIIQETKNLWITDKKKIIAELLNYPLNKRIYSKKKINIWCIEIEHWITKKTKSLKVPQKIKYFNSDFLKINLIKKIPIKHIFFKKIKKILNLYNKFIKNFIYWSKKIIFNITKKKKKSLKILYFNDLAPYIWNQIKNKKSKINQHITNENKVIFIDECQDMDHIQYKIFYKLYKNQKNTSLFLIGDPKQSIYSFRNANIFSYIYFRKKIKKCYSLNKNFRSSKNIIKGINFLFSRINYPFLIKNISFQNSEIYKKNSQKALFINDKKQSSLKFIFYSKKCINTHEYYTWIAKECSNTISYWLNKKLKKKNFIILKKKEKRSIQPNDIAILVKNKYEAQIIKKALKKNRINANFSSEKENIFCKKETEEIYWILDAILNSENSYKFQKILITNIFQINIFEIHQINQKKEKYFKILCKMKKYETIWNQLGIYRMILEIILDKKLYNISYDSPKEKVNINNLLNIANILEKKTEKIQNKILLLNWLKNKITKSKNIKNNIAIDKDLKKTVTHKINVKIITIYKSKGMEYPLVWIPFLSNFSQSKKNKKFFCRKTFKKFINLDNNKKIKKLQEEERLSEDLRLLYVSLTRSILQCNIGLAPIIKKKIYIKKNQKTDLHLSPIGYLLQNGKKKTLTELKKILEKIKLKNIIEITKPNKEIFLYNKEQKKNKFKEKKTINRIIHFPWIKINFSKIYNSNKKLNKKYLKYHINKNKSILNIKKKKENIEIYNFPKGKKYGIFFHNILKKIEFSKLRKIKKIVSSCNNISINKNWILIISNWVKNFISNVDLCNNFQLKKIKKKKYKKELKFLIPIKNHIKIKKLNKIIRKFDPISLRSPKIKFFNFSGILNGTIDLVFFWKNKYFIIDYKSNFLGKNYEDYSLKNIKKEIIKKRYDIQYQFYCLAIHRYLSVHLKKYSYSTHFGGIFLLFLRAFDGINHNNGIFFIKPSFLLIHALDKMFKGKK